MKNTKKLLAFRLRLQGYSYKTIAENTGWSEFTLRKYFSSKGKWYQEYKSWSSNELDQIKEDMHTIILSQAISAAKVIGSMLDQSTTKPHLVLRAAQDILDRAGFQKHSNGFNSSQDSEDYAEDLFIRMEDRKIKNEYEKNNYPHKR